MSIEQLQLRLHMLIVRPERPQLHLVGSVVIVLVVEYQELWQERGNIFFILVQRHVVKREGRISENYQHQHSFRKR